MIVSTEEAVLKGQYNLAQGKRRRSVALGCRAIDKIVRVITFLEGLSLFRTKRHEFQLRPQEVFCPDYCIGADGFLSIPFPQALPGARISWPFRPKLFL
jgi:hypothetical protein